MCKNEISNIGGQITCIQLIRINSVMRVGWTIIELTFKLKLPTLHYKALPETKGWFYRLSSVSISISISSS